MMQEISRRFARLLALWMALAGAGAQAQAPVLRLAGAVSDTGSLADLGTEYRRGLVLWQEQTNAAGGIAGRRVELELADDRSQAPEAARIYAHLIEARRADILIGPYGTAATLAAALAAERAGRVLVNAAAGAARIQRPGTRYVFQVTPAHSEYGAGALELARAAGLKTILVLARKDPPFEEAAQACMREATRLGLRPLPLQDIAATGRDFAAQVDLARKAQAEAWIAFGEPRDAAEMVKTFKRLNYAPGLFVAQGAAEAAFVRALGQDAEYAIGISPWERYAGTAGNADFVRAFSARWSAEPGFAAAQGYAAGRVIEAAVHRAGTLEQEALRRAFSELRADTPLGAHAVDPGSGAQRAARPLLVQIVRGKREIVWPAPYATAPPVLPYPEWKTRKPVGE